MQFLNNVMRGYTAKNPRKYLNEEQNTWMNEVEKAQKTVVINVDE